MTKAFEQHNHKTCREAIMAHVDRRSQDEGLRLTEMRRRVLQILLETHHALGAYDILNRLVAEGVPAQPPIVYRALDFLTAHCFAHKIESQNAYIACQFPDREHTAGFLICRSCKSVGECCVGNHVLDAEDFRVENQMIEAEGLCNACAGAEE